jgi:hypothetical protein
MTERRWSSILALIAPALSGLGGVVLGAYIAGHYQLEAQRLHAQQAEAVERYQGSRALSLDLAGEAAQYLTELSALAVVGAARAQNDKELDNRLKALHRSAFSISLKTSVPATVKVLEANAYVLERLQAKGDPERLKTIEARSKVLGEVYLALYAEVARFRLSALPDAARDELLVSFFQLLTRPETKPK